jgi:hypothetical protein
MSALGHKRTFLYGAPRRAFKKRRGLCSTVIPNVGGTGYHLQSFCRVVDSAFLASCKEQQCADELALDLFAFFYFLRNPAPKRHAPILHNLRIQP